ncbi:MAG: anthranilate synthase component I [Gemmatimonadales bacterium]|nr:MAG: anthranilate synthase component I [Gemmatimonadales bacterium]
MELRPSLEEFQSLSRDGGIVPVWQEFLFDVDTAVTAYAKLARPPFGFLLESVVGGEQWARYSFLGTRPRSAWRLKDGQVALWTPKDGWEPFHCMDPLGDLDARLRAYRTVDVPGLPRFWGGAVGFFSYDVIRYVESLPTAPRDDLGIPDGVFIFTDVVLAIDNLRGKAMAIAAAHVPPGSSEAEAERIYLDAAGRAASLVRDLRQADPLPALELLPEPQGDPDFTSSITRVQFEAGVERIREYIRAGDAFQVVLSQRLGMTLPGSPFDLYRALRSLNPSPYLFYLEMDGVTLVGSSPEVLVRLEDGVVTVRPIAGTRPRGATPEEDRALAADLRTDEKELAEHRMLVDLGRNDVGRVARYGSVRVPDLMVVERYSHVMHLVSQVEGRVAEGRSALDVFRACFPAGTVSGAPKIRAMEIIDELEPVRRGPYAGAVGHFSYGGERMDTAIAIRTVLATEGRAYVQAGAGVVADSDPSAEFEETLNKARALLRAASMVPPRD